MTIQPVFPQKVAYQNHELGKNLTNRKVRAGAFKPLEHKDGFTVSGDSPFTKFDFDRSHGWLPGFGSCFFKHSHGCDKI